MLHLDNHQIDFFEDHFKAEITFQQNSTVDLFLQLLGR